MNPAAHPAPAWTASSKGRIRSPPRVAGSSPVSNRRRIASQPRSTPFCPPRGGTPGSGLDSAAVAVVACIAGLVAVAFWWGDHTRLLAARAQLLQLQQALVERSTVAPAAAPPPPATSMAAPAVSSQATLKPLVLQVPYGADELGGPRLIVIRQMLERLVTDHVSGVVLIRTFAGLFLASRATPSTATPWPRTRCCLRSAMSSESSR